MQKLKKLIADFLCKHGLHTFPSEPQRIDPAIPDPRMRLGVGGGECYSVGMRELSKVIILAMGFDTTDKPEHVFA